MNIADAVTGVVTQVELIVDLPIDEVWKLITDVERIGEWSPECVGAAWHPDQGDVPRVGARFEGRNEYGGGYRATVECVVTDLVEPSVFEWIVLDDALDPNRPGSIWRFELETDENGQKTLIRHKFTHGTGDTGLREGVDARLREARAVLDRRLNTLRGNMIATLHAMVAR